MKGGVRIGRERVAWREGRVQNKGRGLGGGRGQGLGAEPGEGASKEMCLEGSG